MHAEHADNSARLLCYGPRVCALLFRSRSCPDRSFISLSSACSACIALLHLLRKSRRTDVRLTVMAGHVPAIRSESLQRLVAGTCPAMTVHRMLLAFSSYHGDRADQRDCAEILALRCCRQAIAGVSTRGRRSRCREHRNEGIRPYRLAGMSAASTYLSAGGRDGYPSGILARDGASRSLQPVKITVQRPTEIGDHAAEGTRR